ncbi:MAG: APC family permease [Methylotenera sp.]
MRRLQFLQSLSIGVGMAFATSCFAMVTGMVRASGALVIPAIMISILIAMVVAHAIGRMAKRFPSALGIRTYIKAAFGNTTSLFFVFLYLFLLALIAGIESNIYATIVQHVFPVIDGRVIIVSIFLVVIVMNVFGYEFSKNAQLLMVLLMLCGVFGLSFYGLAHSGLKVAAFHNTTPEQFAALSTTIVSAFFLFVGFEWVTSSQPGTRSAASQLPLVLLASVLLLGCVYLAFSMVVITNLSHSELVSDDSPQMLLASKLWGVVGIWTMLAVSTCAILTSFNAGVLGASRLMYSLAREGFLPRIFSTTARFSGAPVYAIATTTIMSLCSALVAFSMGNIYLLGSVAAVTICICYSGLLSASLKLHRPNSPNPQLRTGTMRFVQLIEFFTLLLMAMLLLTLLYQGNNLFQVTIVFATIGILVLLAIFTNRNSIKPSVKVSTAP